MRTPVVLTAFRFEDEDREQLASCAFLLRAAGVDVTTFLVDTEDNVLWLSAMLDAHADWRVVVGLRSLPRRTPESPAYTAWVERLVEEHREQPERLVLVRWLGGRECIPPKLEGLPAIGLDRPLGPRRLLAALGVAQSDVETSVARLPEIAIRAPLPDPERSLFGFEEIALRVAKLVREAADRPRTISVEGPWGAGKTTFLQLLETAFRRPLAASVDAEEWRVLWLHPWKFDKAEGLWVAFAQALEDLAESRRQRMIRRLQLAVRRVLARPGPLVPTGLKLVAAVGVLVVALLVAWSVPDASREAARLAAALAPGPMVTASAVPSAAPSPAASAAITPASDGAQDRGKAWGFLIVAIGGVLAGTPSLLFIARALSQLTSFDALKKDFGDASRSEIDESKLPFLHAFHEELARIVAVYVRTPTLVIVDDLDRCEVPVAAEIFQAINLMIPGSSDLVFAVAFDRDKVAASVAARHDRVLPLLAPAAARSGFDARGSLDYGRAFLQKFVHLPVRLPRPAPADLAKLGVRDDPSDVLRQTVDIVAGALDGNPRRMRHFLNVLGLHPAATWSASGFGPGDSAKLLAIGLRWPQLLDAIAEDPDLLTTLEELALDRDGIAPGRLNHLSVQGWGDNEALLALLRHGFPRDGAPSAMVRGFVGRELGPLLVLAGASTPTRSS